MLLNPFNSTINDLDEFTKPNSIITIQHFTEFGKDMNSVPIISTYGD